MWPRYPYTNTERPKDKYQQIMDDIDEIRKQQKDISKMELSEDTTKVAIAELEAKIAVLKLELVACASEY